MGENCSHYHSSPEGQRRWNWTAHSVGALAFLGLAVLVTGGCAESTDDAERSDAAGAETPTVVVTTNILGDVVSNLLGDQATVETIIPQGSDPHEFQASARQVNAMYEADVLVVNGAAFEEGLLDTIESVESDGVPVCVAIDQVDTIEFGDATHDDHEGVDPHFFTDPARMAVAAEGLTTCILDAVPELDAEEVRSTADAYVAQLEALDSGVEATLGAIPEENRVLITNHEVFGYFADRFGFEVVGTIIPSLSTQAEASAADLADLAGSIEAEGVAAVFADTSSPDQLAEALAAEVGDVEVVELFSESLGADGAETYIVMVRTNAERISTALG